MIMNFEDNATLKKLGCREYEQNGIIGIFIKWILEVGKTDKMQVYVRD